MDFLQTHRLSYKSAINEIVPPIELVGNNVRDFSFGSIKPKSMPTAPALVTRENNIKTNSGGYNMMTIHNKVGHISNLLY